MCKEKKETAAAAATAVSFRPHLRKSKTYLPLFARTQALTFLHMNLFCEALQKRQFTVWFN